MSNRKMAGLFILVLFVCLTFVRFERPSVSTSPAPVGKILVPALIGPINPQKKMPETDPHFPKFSRSEYLSQAKADSHHTPESLLLFAQKLAPFMDQALQGSGTERLFKYFDACVKSSGPLSLRAICIANAKRLSEGFRRFKGPFQVLWAEAPLDLKLVVRALHL